MRMWPADLHLLPQAASSGALPVRAGGVVNKTLSSGAQAYLPRLTPNEVPLKSTEGRSVQPELLQKNVLGQVQGLPRGWTKICKKGSKYCEFIISGHVRALQMKCILYTICCTRCPALFLGCPATLVFDGK